MEPVLDLRRHVSLGFANRVNARGSHQSHKVESVQPTINVLEIFSVPMVSVPVEERLALRLTDPRLATRLLVPAGFANRVNARGSHQSHKVESVQPTINVLEIFSVPMVSVPVEERLALRLTDPRLATRPLVPAVFVVKIRAPQSQLDNLAKLVQQTTFASAKKPLVRPQFTVLAMIRLLCRAVDPLRTA
ncbi:hypothetical protein QFC21_005129 [Naganishia friedmannii]|uniref:Uncharacterized protein n=1 Tax=Naganishia friedmannii TaxID=89922 RepID=A0ACC2VDC3_9TREE|nr:hypothetical protein QFC21_005129 [Naganishia friedmannii]